MRLPKPALAILLACTMFATACTMSQFDAVLNQIGPAITAIIDIIAIVRGTPANLNIASKVSADVAGIEKLQTDLAKATSTSAPGIKADINAGFTVLTADLSTVYAMADVKDPNTQAKISALIALCDSAVQIAEAAIPSSAVLVSAKTVPNLTASDLVASWNKILIAKTGNKAVDSYTSKHELHLHSKLVRVITLGVKN